MKRSTPLHFVGVAFGSSPKLLFRLIPQIAREGNYINGSFSSSHLSLIAHHHEIVGNYNLKFRPQPFLSAQQKKTADVRSLIHLLDMTQQRAMLGNFETSRKLEVN